MTIRRYGKSIAGFLDQKTSFFSDNAALVREQREFAALYGRQPRRERCKTCDAPIPSAEDFRKDGIGYSLCPACGHLNGMHEDDDSFCDLIYNQAGESFADHYSAESREKFEARLETIYAPKAGFLVDSLAAHGADPASLSYLDFGAGSGYMVGALRKAGMGKVAGTEVSAAQVAFGNRMLGADLLSTHAIGDSLALLGQARAQVISMIGVLEHLRDPREAMRRLRANPAVRFVFLTVPTLGPSTFLEAISPEIYHRQLSGGHTHLYTSRSLEHLYREFGFRPVAEWWFGTDAVDIYRAVMVGLQQAGASEAFVSRWKEAFLPLIDSLQLCMDKAHQTSEVHVLIEKLPGTGP